MPVLWVVGSLLVGVVAFRAGSRFMDNVQEAHRRGMIAKAKTKAFVGYQDGLALAEYAVEPYSSEATYWVYPGVDIGRWNGSEVQSLMFERNLFTPQSARAWAFNHGFLVPYGVDEKMDTIRIRQIHPKYFKDFRTIQLKPGVQAIVGPVLKLPYWRS